LYPNSAFTDPATLTRRTGEVWTAIEIHSRTAAMSGTDDECTIEMETAGMPFDVMVLPGPLRSNVPDLRPVQRAKTPCQQVRLAAELFEPYIRE
jgi:hypothetical protein